RPVRSGDPELRHLRGRGRLLHRGPGSGRRRGGRPWLARQPPRHSPRRGRRARGGPEHPPDPPRRGVGARRHDDTGDDDDDDDDEPDNRIYVGFMAGTHCGYATGNGDTNAATMINPPGLALSGAAQFSPEAGYWLTSSLLLSLQIRYQIITGTTDIFTPTHTYHTADYPLPAFARATWKYGEGSFPPFFSLAAGGGRIRHVVSFKRQSLTNCGPAHHETCIDTHGRGAGALRPPGG